MPVHYPTGPWLRVVMFFSNDEKSWQNVLWYKVTAPVPGDVNVDTVASDVSTAIEATVLPILPPGANYNGVNVYLNNGTYTVAAENNMSVAGTAPDTGIPTEDAAIVSLNSGVGTRAGVGRLYLGQPSETNVSESKINSTGEPLYEAFKNSLMTLVTAGGVAIKLAVWSRKLGVLEPVVFATVRTILGHRRKRRPTR